MSTSMLVRRSGQCLLKDNKISGMMLAYGAQSSPLGALDGEESSTETARRRFGVFSHGALVGVHGDALARGRVSLV